MVNNSHKIDIERIVQLTQTNRLFTSDEKQGSVLLNLASGYFDEEIKTSKNLIPRYVPISERLTNTLSSLGVLGADFTVKLNNESNFVFSTLPDIHNIISLNNPKTAYDILNKQLYEDFLGLIPRGVNQYGVVNINYSLDKNKFINYYDGIKKGTIKDKNFEGFYNLFEVNKMSIGKETIMLPDAELLLKSPNKLVNKIQTTGVGGGVYYGNSDYKNFFSRMYSHNLSIVFNSSNTIDTTLITQTATSNDATIPDSIFKVAAEFNQYQTGQGIMNNSKIGVTSDMLYVGYDDLAKSLNINNLNSYFEEGAKKAKEYNKSVSYDNAKDFFFKVSFNPSNKKFTEIEAYSPNGKVDYFLTKVMNDNLDSSQVLRSSIMEKVNYHSSRFRHTVTLDDLALYNEKLKAINNGQYGKFKTKEEASIFLANYIKNDQSAHALDSNGFRNFLEKQYNNGEEFKSNKKYVNAFYQFYDDVVSKNKKEYKNYIISDELENLKKYIDNNLNVGVLTGQIMDGIQFDNLLSVAKQTAVINGKLRNASQSILTPLSHLNTDLQRKAQAQDFYQKWIITDGQGTEVDSSIITRGFFSHIREHNYKKLAYRYLQGEKHLEANTRVLGLSSIPNAYQNQAKIIYTETDAAWQDSNMFTKSFAMQNVSMKDFKRPMSINYNTLKKDVVLAGVEQEKLENFFSELFNKIQTSDSQSISFNGLFGDSVEYNDIKNLLIKNLLGESNYNTFINTITGNISEDFAQIGSAFNGINQIVNNEVEYVKASNEMARKFNEFTGKYFMKANASSSIQVLNPNAVGSGQNTRIKGMNFAHINDIRFTKNGIEIVMDQLLTQSEGSKVLIDNVKATTQSLTDLIYLQLDNGNKIFAEGFVNEKMTKGSRGFSGTYFARDLQTMAMNAIYTPLKDEVKKAKRAKISVEEYRFNQWKDYMSGSFRKKSRVKNLIGTFNVFDLFNIDMRLDMSSGTPTLVFDDKTVDYALEHYKDYEGASLDKAIVRGMNQHLQRLFGRNGEINVKEDAYLGNYATDLLFENHEAYLDNVEETYRDNARVLIRTGSLYKSYSENDVAKFTKINDLDSSRGYTHIWNANIHMMSESKKRATDEALKIGRLSSIVAKEFGFDELVSIIENNAIENVEDFLSDYLGLASINIKDTNGNEYNFGRGSDFYQARFGLNKIDLSDPSIDINKYSLSDDYQSYISNSLIGKRLDFNFEKEKLNKPLYGELTNINEELTSSLKRIFSTTGSDADEYYSNINKMGGRLLLESSFLNDSLAIESRWKKLEISKQKLKFDKKEMSFTLKEIQKYNEQIKEFLPQIDIEKAGLGLFDLQNYFTVNEGGTITHGFNNVANKYQKEFKKLLIENVAEDNQKFIHYINSMYDDYNFSFDSRELHKMFVNFGYGLVSELKNNKSIKLSPIVNANASFSNIPKDNVKFNKFLNSFNNFNIEKKSLMYLNQTINNILKLDKSGKSSVSYYDDIKSLFNLILNPSLFSGEHLANFSELAQIGNYGSIPFLIDQLAIDENGQIVPNTSLSNTERIIRSSFRLNQKQRELNFFTTDALAVRERINKKHSIFKSNVDESIKTKLKANLAGIRKLNIDNDKNYVVSEFTKLFDGFDPELNETFKKEITDKTLLYTYLREGFAGKSDNVYYNNKLKELLENHIKNNLFETDFSPNMLKFLDKNDKKYVSHYVYKFLLNYISGADGSKSKKNILNIFNDLSDIINSMPDNSTNQILSKELSSLKDELEYIAGKSLRNILSDASDYYNNIYNFFSTDKNNLLPINSNSKYFNQIKELYEDYLDSVNSYYNRYEQVVKLNPNDRNAIRDYYASVDKAASNLIENLSGIAPEEVRFYNEFSMRLRGLKKDPEYLQKLKNGIDREKNILIGLIAGRHNKIGEEIFAKGGRAAELISMKVNNSAAVSPREGSIITNFIKEEMIDLLEKKSKNNLSPEEIKELENDRRKLSSDLKLIYGSENVNEYINKFNNLFDEVYDNRNKGQEFYLNTINEIKDKLNRFSHIIIGTEDEYRHLNKMSLFDHSRYAYGILSRHPHQYKSSLTPVKYVLLKNEDLKNGFLSRFYSNGTKMPWTQSSLSFIGKNTALSAKGDFDGDVFQIMFIGEKDLSFSKFGDKRRALKVFQDKLVLYHMLNNVAGDDLESIFNNSHIMNYGNKDIKAQKYQKMKRYIEALFNKGQELSGQEAYNIIKLDYLSLTNEKSRVLQMLDDEFKEHGTTPEVFGSFKFSGKSISDSSYYDRSISKKTLSYFMLTADQDTRREMFFNQDGFNLKSLRSSIKKNKYLSKEMKAEFNSILDIEGGIDFIKNSLVELQDDKNVIRWHLLFNSINKFLDDSGIAKTGMVHNALTSIRETYTSFLDVDNIEKILKFGNINSINGLTNVDVGDYHKLAKEYSYLLKAAGMNHDLGTLIEKLAVSAKKGSVDPSKKLKLFEEANSILGKDFNNYSFNLRRMAEVVTDLSSKDLNNPFIENSRSIYNIKGLSTLDLETNFLDWFKQFYISSNNEKYKTFDKDMLKISRIFLGLSDINVDDISDIDLSKMSFNQIFGKNKLTSQKLSTLLSTWTLINNKSSIENKLNIKEINRNFFDQILGKTSGANIFKRMFKFAESTLGLTTNNAGTRFETNQFIKASLKKALEKPFKGSVIEDVQEYDVVDEISENTLNKVGYHDVDTSDAAYEDLLNETLEADNNKDEKIQKVNEVISSNNSSQNKVNQIVDESKNESTKIIQPIEETEEVVKARNFYNNYEDAYSDTPLAHSQISVEPTNINKIETNYSEEIASLKNEINSLNSTIESQKTEINSLTSKLADTATSQDEINNANRQTDDYKKLLDDAKKEIEELQNVINNKNKIINESNSDSNSTINKLQQQVETLQDNIAKLQEKLNKEKEKRKALKNAGEYFDRAQDKFKAVKETVESNPNIAKYKNKAIGAAGIGALALFFRIFQKSRPVVNLDINEQEYERSQGSIYRNLGQYNINTNIRSLY